MIFTDPIYQKIDSVTSLISVCNTSVIEEFITLNNRNLINSIIQEYLVFKV